jgi:D-alanyl-D-alanine dipeptidase
MNNECYEYGLFELTRGESMNCASYLYFRKLRDGVDPFRKFVGKEYEILIPMHDLESFSYAPAYGNEYRELGIYDLTYSVNPTMYAAMVQLDKLAKIYGIKFRVADAWSPSDFRDQKRKEWAEREAIEQTGKNNPFSEDTPHGRGAAIDLVMTDGYGNVVTQPKWLANSKSEFNKVYPEFLQEYPDLKKYTKSYTDKYFDNKPIFNSPHMEPTTDAPKELKGAALSMDFLARLVSSIGNVAPINAENWHFQLTNKESYKTITSEEQRRVSAGHLARVKKEVTDFANRAFGLFYERSIVKGQPHKMWEDDKIDDTRTMTMADLRGKLDGILHMQRGLLR